MLVYILFLSLGIIFLLLSYLIWKKQKLILISTVDNKVLSRINNKNKLAKEFGELCLSMSIVCLAAPLLMYSLKWVGTILSMSTLVILAFIGTFKALRIDSKIDKGIY